MQLPPLPWVAVVLLTAHPPITNVEYDDRIGTVDAHSEVFANLASRLRHQQYGIMPYWT